MSTPKSLSREVDVALSHVTGEPEPEVGFLLEGLGTLGGQTKLRGGFGLGAGCALVRGPIRRKLY